MTEREANSHDSNEPVAWYVERQHVGFRDHGLKYGPFWKLSEAEEWADCCHILKPLYTTQPKAQPEQEPVAITITGKLGNIYSFTGDYSLKKGDKVYTTPPQRTWVGLTDEEIILIVADCASSHQHTDIHFARAIEAAHGIKE